MANDRSLAVELLGVYIEEMPPTIDQLQQALDQQNIGEIKRIIHTQQVHTKMLGLLEATRLILETEVHVSDKMPITAISPLIEQYIREVNSVLPLIS